MFKLCAFLFLILVHNVQNNPVSKNENLFDKPVIEKLIKEWRESNPEPCSKGEKTEVFDLDCNLEDDVINEIHSYQEIVNDIIQLFVSGEFKGQTYDLLALLTDTFGSRLTGSDELEDAINWVVARSFAEGFQVHTEDVTAPKWVRNHETLTMLAPRVQDFELLSLGSSVNTSSSGLTAEAIVVSSFDDLHNHSSEAAGKFVVYDVPFTTYSDTVKYRSQGAVEAAKVGAVGSLIRSVTDFSINSPHTGTQNYDSDLNRIPSVAITVEDASMLHRMYDNGEQIILHLSMEAQNYPDIVTMNTVVEIPGASKPEEVVLVSGHLDSWDVGTGSMDDAGGCVISWMAGKALIGMNITPSRTFRIVMFTAEEQGIYGGEEYFRAHYEEASNFQIMMESDYGTFNPRGIGFSGSNYSKCVMQEILSLTDMIDTTELIFPAETPDLGLFGAVGVPRGSLNNENDRYFWFHHSDGDHINVYEPDVLDKVAALWTSVSYVLSDVSFRLPQEPPQLN